MLITMHMPQRSSYFSTYPHHLVPIPTNPKTRKSNRKKNNTKTDTCWPSLKTCVKVATNVNHHQKRIPLQHPQWSYRNRRSHRLPIHSKLGARSPRIWPWKKRQKGFAKSCQVVPKSDGNLQSIKMYIKIPYRKKKKKPSPFSVSLFWGFLFSIVQSVGQKIKIKMVTFWNSAWVFLVDAFNRCLGVVPLPHQPKKIMP